MSEDGPFGQCEIGEEILVRYMCPNEDCQDEGGEWDVWIVVDGGWQAHATTPGSGHCPGCEEAGALVLGSVEGYRA